MPADSIVQGFQTLLDAGLITESTLLGCEEREIVELEHDLGLRLPTTYRKFLKTAGKSAGTFLEGTDFLYSDLKTLQTDAVRLLRECKVLWRPTKADFVFAAHQGYQFLFFDTSKGDDPAVHLFLEGEEGPREVAPSFSSWFMQCALEEIAD
jgi:SMI1 / KNR4 family (SUKH-1)